jgi:hypothetical protein
MSVAFPHWAGDGTRRRGGAGLSVDERKLVERGTEAVMLWQVGADRVVPAAQVLHEGVSRCNGARGGAQSFESTQRAKPSLQSAVIAAASRQVETRTSIT